MLKKILFALLLIIALFFIGLFIIRITPHGLLDTRTAIALKMMPEREGQVTVEQQREGMRKTVAQFAKDIPLDYVEDKVMNLEGRSLPIRLYSEAKPQNLPILIYYHGGGWVVGDLDTHDSVCRQIAKAANVLVISVAYRLAPEHPFPIPMEDSYAALEWIAQNATALGGNPNKIAVGGDSAGGNLSAAVALKSRDEQGPAIAYQVLIYPATNLSKLEYV